MFQNYEWYCSVIRVTTRPSDIIKWHSLKNQVQRKHKGKEGQRLYTASVSTGRARAALPPACLLKKPSNRTQVPLQLETRWFDHVNISALWSNPKLFNLLSNFFGSQIFMKPGFIEPSNKLKVGIKYVQCSIIIPEGP